MLGTDSRLKTMLRGVVIVYGEKISVTLCKNSKRGKVSLWLGA